MIARHAFLIGILFLVLQNLANAQEDTYTLTSFPPVVVKTEPQAGDAKADPSMNEIRVTYSKRMQNGSWSWSTVTDETNPEVTGKPRYLSDGKTCVLPVKLEPNRIYGFWLNSEKFGNSKDRQGQSAVPYLLVFKTANAGEKSPQ